jgi:hypothetical protein
VVRDVERDNGGGHGRGMRAWLAVFAGPGKPVGRMTTSGKRQDRAFLQGRDVV